MGCITILSVPENVPSNDGEIDEYWIGGRGGRKKQVQWRYCPSICSGGLNKNTGNLSQSSGCPGRYSNLAPPVCIPRTPTQSVWLRVYGCTCVCYYIILHYIIIVYYILYYGINEEGNHAAGGEQVLLLVYSTSLICTSVRISAQLTVFSGSLYANSHQFFSPSY